MIYASDQLEQQAVLHAAQAICAAARTAPKGGGRDAICTLVLTGEEKDALAATMAQLSETLGYRFFARDAQSVAKAQALVLIGLQDARKGLGENCAYCGFPDCQENERKGGTCFISAVDLGIAVGSAVALAADLRVDNRVMFSAGRAALASGLFPQNVRQALGIPLSSSGKSPFFDRK